MNKGFSILIVAVIIVIIGLTVYFSAKGKENSEEVSSSSNTSKNVSADTLVDNPVAILFYGDGCPHCAKVEKWLSDNKVAEKVKFNVLEVWKNQDNSKLLSQKAEACGISDENSIGVPFLYDIANNKCLSGETDVENFFKSKI